MISEEEALMKEAQERFPMSDEGQILYLLAKIIVELRNL